MKRLFLTAVTASLLSSAFLISVPAAQAEEAAYKLVLLRHGESQWNLEKRFTGWSDIDLTDKGRAGAVKAGEIMKGAGVNFDEVHTSKLNRAIETAQLAQKGMSAQWVPLQKFWRLNERCYGDLEGKKREDVAKEVGDDQVKIWRRSFDVPPPSLAVTDARSPVKDPRYADLDPRVIPASESLRASVRIGQISCARRLNPERPFLWSDTVPTSEPCLLGSSRTWMRKRFRNWKLKTLSQSCMSLTKI